MWHRRQRDLNAPASDVVEEATRLLTGRARETIPPAHGAPAWVAVNLLAHGTESQLRGAAAPRDHMTAAGWTAALAYLSSALLAFAATEGDLTSVQREVLVPLELALLAGTATAPSTLGQLAALVMDALDTHRVRRDP